MYLHDTLANDKFCYVCLLAAQADLSYKLINYAG